jgi:hypothetical protein
VCKFGNSAGNCVQDALAGDGVLRSISVLLTQYKYGQCCLLLAKLLCLKDIVWLRFSAECEILWKTEIEKRCLD